jgi:Lrp/AsnC family transcriptional regulator, regulator for asnA, asnC and gidA
MKSELDQKNLQIIQLLQKDGRMASSEIAKQVGISEATVRYRLKKLIDGNYIQIVAVGNPFKLGFGIAASISVYAEMKQVDQVIIALEKLDRLSYIVQMTSDPSIELETYVESIEELHELLSKIEKIDGITKVSTTFIRKIIRERYDWGTPGGPNEN